MVYAVDLNAQPYYSKKLNINKEILYHSWKVFSRL